MGTSAVCDFDASGSQEFVSATGQNSADRLHKSAVPPDTDTAGTAIWQYLCVDACSR